MNGLTKGVACVILTASMSACVQVGPKSLPAVQTACPKLTAPPAPQCPKLTVESCNRYDLPPIGNTVTIRIRDNVVEADAGGELLIREYARAQRLLRSP